MKTFIGIGSDHEKEVFDEVQKLLWTHTVQVITLEYAISVWNAHDSSRNPRLKKRKAELLENSVEFIVHYKGKYPVIAVNDFLVYDPSRYKLRNSELSAGIDFALRHALPFYLVDWSNDFPDTIFEFKSGRMKAISLDGRTTYQDYPDEFMKLSRNFIFSENVDARNRFSSDAHNYLLENYDSLAHIGGSGHFDSATPLAISFFGMFYKLSQGLELQNLVKAERKVVYDAVKKVILEDKAEPLIHL